MTGTAPVVLLTGVTGLVGKAVLSELIRRRRELGWSRVIAVVRAPEAGCADERLSDEVLDSACFAAESPGFERGIEAVPGDVRVQGVVPSEAASRLRDVTHVIHCAASVDFTLSPADATAVNTDGVLNVLELARAAPRIASLVAVSTAYVAAHTATNSRAPLRVEEALAHLDFDLDAIHARMRDGRVDAQRILDETGHPNTYTLSKCLAEHLVARRHRSVPVTIVRPSVVSASRARPHAGWIDSTTAFAGFVAMIGAGRLRVIAGDPRTRLDIVPCDDVAERIVDAAFDPPAAGSVRIRHAVAGLDGTCSLDLCRERIERYFPMSVDGSPNVARVVRRGARFQLAQLVHQELPGIAASLGLMLRRERRLAHALDRVRERQRVMNRDFAYFTHATFDFRTSRPLSPALDPVHYLDTVCAGVARHLVRRRARLERLNLCS